MLASDVMKKNLITVSVDTTVEEVARLLVENEISGMPVVNSDNVAVGVVSEMDLMRKEIKPNDPSVWQICVWGLNNTTKIDEYKDSVRKYMAKTAGEIMSSPVISVTVNDDLETVGKLMFDKKVKRVIVTDKGKLAGMISRSAFVELLLEKKDI